MSGKAFRFLHTSDFRLELPVLGVTDVPAHLRESLIDAPYRAAQAVFDAALAERVDFIALAGNIIHPHAAGPRGVQFLQDQFERLQKQRISVYWSRGPRDHTELWPSQAPLPANVHVLPSNRVSSITHRIENQPVLTVQGCSQRESHRIRPAEFTGDATRFTVAVAYGAAESESLRTARVNYWALGGRPDRQALFTSPSVAQYAGSPQGRSPDETDAHGCLLVDVDEAGVVTQQVIPTDVVLWHTERFRLPEQMDRQSLLEYMRDRTRRLGQAHADKLLIVSWHVADADQFVDTQSDRLAAQLRQSNLSQEIVTALRNEFGTSVPGVWTESLSADTPVVYPDGWYEEDTVLGDLLRAVQHFQETPDETVELDAWNADPPLTPELADALRLSGAADRESVLRRVAALGVDLLRGDRVLSEEHPSINSWSDTVADQQ